MFHFNKNERPGILINSLSSLVVLVATGYGAALLMTPGSSRSHTLPSWGEIFVAAALPLLLAGVMSFLVPTLSRWNGQSHRQLVTFVTVIGSYLAYELFRIVVSAIQNLYSVVFPDVVLWMLVAVITVLIATGTWKSFYVWKRTLRTKLVVFAVLAIPLYLLLPLLQTYVLRLTYAISL